MLYPLEKRTTVFGKKIILFCKKIEKNTLIKPLQQQLIRSATSIGANYQEANGSYSKKEFRHKILLCKKESMETKYWIELIAHSDEMYKNELRMLWLEAHELTLIFSKIAKSSQEKLS